MWLNHAVFSTANLGFFFPFFFLLVCIIYGFVCPSFGRGKDQQTSDFLAGRPQLCWLKLIFYPVGLQDARLKQQYNWHVAVFSAGAEAAQ